MKKNTIIAMMAIITVIILLIGCSENPDVKNAKESMELGRYAQAIKYWQKAKEVKPNDYKIDYQIGICYFNEKNARMAIKYLQLASEQNPSDVSKMLLTAGLELVNNNRLRGAGFLLNRAKKYNKAIMNESTMNEIINICMEKGKNGDHYAFSLAKSLDVSLSGEIADFYWSKGDIHSLEKAREYNKAKYNDKLADYYGNKGDLNSLKKACKYRAVKYDSIYDRKLLEVANNQSTPKQRSKYINKAIKRGASSKQIFVSSLEYYSRLYGKPKKIELTTSKYIKVATVKRGDKIYYLSQENFWSKKERGKRLYPSSIKRAYCFTYMLMDMIGNDTPVWFKKNKRNTTAYYWVKKSK